MTDNFQGDNAALALCIKALLDLDSKGSLVPHGIGGHARALLSAAAARLSQPAQPAASVEPVAHRAWHQSIKGEWYPSCWDAGPPPKWRMDEVAKKRQRIEYAYAAPVAAQPSVPGYKLVPVEPTEEMMQAGYWNEETCMHSQEDAYAAMLAAAPNPPANWQPQQDADMVACACGDMYPATSYGAGYIDAAGMCENCHAAACGAQNAECERQPALRDWEISCGECCGSGYVRIKRQVAERDTDVITSREPCEVCDERGYVIAHGDVPGIEEYVDGRQHNHLPDAAKMVGQAEDARDAARYRYLRDDGDGDETWVMGYPPTELDAAIDAAMQQERQP